MSADPPRPTRRQRPRRGHGGAHPLDGRARTSSASPKPDPILVADGVHRQFGGLVAVDVDHVEIQRGLITGADRAQRRRQDDVLQPAHRVRRARPRARGRSTARTSPGSPGYKLARAGMVRTFQLTKSLSRAVGDGEHEARRPAPDRRALLVEPAAADVARPGEGDRGAGRRAARRASGSTTCATSSPASLSGGQRKLLEMARALMADPHLIMLDEPMAGVNPALTQSLLGHIKSLRDEGRTVLFVEHDMDVVHDISDWVIVMAEGRVIAEGPADSIGTNTEVIDAYLGAHHDLDLGRRSRVSR